MSKFGLILVVFLISAVIIFLGVKLGNKIKEGHRDGVTSKRKISIMFFAVALIASQLKSDSLFMSMFAAKSKLVIAAEKNINMLKEHERFWNKAKVMNKEDLAQYFDLLRVAGIKRLDHRHLSAMHKFKIKLSKNNEDVCASLWTGDGLVEEQNKALEHFSAKELDLLMKIRYRAALLEFDKAKYPKIPKDIVKISMKKIGKTLEKSDARKWNLLSNSKQKLSKSDSCWMTRKMLQGANKLDRKTRDRLLRRIL